MLVSAISGPPVCFLSEGTFLKGDRVLKTANRTVDFFPFRVLYPSTPSQKWRKKTTSVGREKSAVWCFEHLEGTIVEFFGKASGESLPEVSGKVSEWFFRLAAGNLNRVFLSPPAKGFWQGCFSEGACGPALFKGKSFFVGGFLFFSLRGGGVASGEGFFAVGFVFSHPGGEWACGPAFFALQAQLAFGKSLFLSEQKK